MKNVWKCARGCFPAALVGLLMANAGWADEIVVRTYAPPSGPSVGSVSLRLSESLPARGQLDHVILLDTSASQVGEHRQASLDALRSYVASLPSNDRVEVIAYDVKPVSLTNGMLAPEEAGQVAANAMARRFPAGSANLHAALEFALSRRREAPLLPCW